MYEFLYHRRKSSFFAITGCLILFASPMIQFLSSIDLKVDMAVLFLGIVSMMQLMRITTALAKKK